MNFCFRVLFSHRGLFLLKERGEVPSSVIIITLVIGPWEDICTSGLL